MPDTIHLGDLDTALLATGRLVQRTDLERPAMDAACDAYLALHRVRDALAARTVRQSDGPAQKIRLMRIEKVQDFLNQISTVADIVQDLAVSAHLLPQSERRDEVVEGLFEQVNILRKLLNLECYEQRS